MVTWALISSRDVSLTRLTTGDKHGHNHPPFTAIYTPVRAIKWRKKGTKHAKKGTKHTNKQADRLDWSCLTGRHALLGKPQDKKEVPMYSGTLCAGAEVTGGGEGVVGGGKGRAEEGALVSF